MMKKLHFNRGQFLAYWIGAKRTKCIWGRGTGKTTHAIAPFFARNVVQMPRSLNGLVGASYSMLQERVFQKVILGFEKLGFREGVHFLIGKYGTAKGWKKPYQSPVDPKHIVHFWNGSALMLISLAKKGMSNGLDLDSLAGDEAKFFDYELLQEAQLTLRGNREYFGHCSFHHSQLYTSDMPTDSSGYWLFQDEMNSVDAQTIEIILLINKYISELKTKYKDKPSKRILQEIEEWEEQLTTIRRGKDGKGISYFSLADTIDNIDALGIDAIDNLALTLDPYKFRTSVLNERPKAVEHGFYGALDFKKHTYILENEAYIETMPLRSGKIQRDCRWDADWVQNKPIDIALDYNLKIISLVVGQAQANKEYRIINSMYALDKPTLERMAQQFHDYYQYAPNRSVRYYFDNTAHDESLNTRTSYATDFANALRKLGWKVDAKYLKQLPDQNSRYYAWKGFLEDSNPQAWQIRFNKDSCRSLLRSMQLTATINQNGKTKKDKRTENDGITPPQDAPHLSDALDNLITAAMRYTFRKAAQTMDVY